MKKVLAIFILFLLIQPFALAEEKTAGGGAVTKEKTTEELLQEIRDIKLDRDNLLKQTQAIQKEKEALKHQIGEMESSSTGAVVQIDSLKKEIELLNGEIVKLKDTVERDRQASSDEKQALEKRIADEQARANSLVRMMEEYTPDKIQSLIDDNNRLADENKRLAQRVFEEEKRLEEMRKQMTPLELDREELHKTQAELKEMKKRIQYVEKLEKRQSQLIKENAEYRERLEVMKGKFKEAVPGLAKASRVSQKMMRENADMHYNLGTIFLQNKKFKESIREFEHVLELRPNDPDTHYNLGVLYDDYLKDREKALYHYQKYLSVNPKAPDAKKVENYILSLELEQKVR